MKQDFLRLIIQGLQRTGDSLSRGFPALSQPLATCKQVASCLLSEANHPVDGREEVPKAHRSRPEVLGAGPRLDPHKVSSVGEVGRSKAPKRQNAHLSSLPWGLKPPTFHSFWR